MKKMKPRRRGVHTEKMDRLYDDLHRAGIVHGALQGMSLRQAALQRYGSPEASN